MNPLAQSALGAIVRAGLLIVAGVFVKYNIWTGEEAASYVSASSAAIIALGWSLFEKWWARQDFLAAMVSDPGKTGAEVKALARSGVAPSPTTSDKVPVHATSATRSFMGTPLMVLLAAAALASSVGLSACAGRQPVVTPAQGADLAGDIQASIRTVTDEVSKGAKSGVIPVRFSDPYMKAIDEKVLPVARQVKNALDAWQAATTIDLQTATAAELRKTLAQFEVIARNAFGLELPDGPAKSLANTIESIYSTIEKIRALVLQIRTPVAGRAALAFVA